MHPRRYTGRDGITHRCWYTEGRGFHPDPDACKFGVCVFSPWSRGFFPPHLESKSKYLAPINFHMMCRTNINASGIFVQSLVTGPRETINSPHLSTWVHHGWAAWTQIQDLGGANSAPTGWLASPVTLQKGANHQSRSTGSGRVAGNYPRRAEGARAAPGERQWR